MESRHPAPSPHLNERGTAAILALAFLSVLLILTSLFVSNLISSTNFESSLEAKTKSFYLAEAGLNHAIWKLEQQGTSYKGEKSVRFSAGRFDILVEDDPADSKKKVIFSVGKLDGYARNRASQIRAVARLKHAGGNTFHVTIDSWDRLN
ncbi:MAG: hypothetical protein HY801_15600 [Candidatus Lindowbacteria bacterium]|nr:hypothetical protein [Candidatus Lindowbacteria bacterium]